MPSNYNWITPHWPAPLNVKALTTVRQGGNFALHVGDDPKAVFANRAQLKLQANLPAEPLWLAQTHSIRVVDVAESVIDADGSVAFQPNQVCAVLTGDCLPILLCNKAGTRISAIHAGWKGLAAGIVEVAIRKLDCDPSTLMAWLGPGIGPNVYEVQEDFLSAFKDYQSEITFKPKENGRWLANMYALATERLKRLGITAVYTDGFCTYQDSKRFYSARRSATTGRMATLIWLSNP